MALDFPNSPIDGQVYDNYYWDEAQGVWNSIGNYDIPSLLANGIFTSSGSSIVPLTVKGAPSQAANLQEWKNNSGTTLASMSASGGLTLNNALTVGSGGTGATSLTSGAYLKGNGSNAIQTQTGIPAGDVTSGQLGVARVPSGSIVQVVQTVDYSTTTISSGVDTSFIRYNGLNTTITPKLSGSKFLMRYQINIGAYSGSVRAALIINSAYYNSAGTGMQTASTNSHYITAGLPGSATIQGYTGEYLFSNSGTNNVVVTFDILKQDPNYNVFVNRGHTYDDNPRGRPTSWLTIMEVAP